MLQMLLLKKPAYYQCSFWRAPTFLLMVLLVNKMRAEIVLNDCTFLIAALQQLFHLDDPDEKYADFQSKTKSSTFLAELHEKQQHINILAGRHNFRHFLEAVIR